MLHIRHIAFWGLYVKGADVLRGSQDEQVQIVALYYIVFASQKRVLRCGTPS